MTEYDDGSRVATRDAYDIDEEAAAEHYHASKHARHIEHYWYDKWVSPHHGKLACIIAFSFLILFIVIFAIYFALAYSYNDHVYTHSMDMATLSARNNPFESHALYSLSAGGRRTEYRASRCHSDYYHAVWRNDPNGVAKASLIRTPTEELAKLVTLRPYVIDVDINVRYNVERANAFPGGATSSSSKDERYIVTRLNLASSFTGFSTIRLIESAVDIYRRTVRTVRSLTLCSDDPISSAGRCKQYITLDGTMIINNNTYTMPMDQPDRKAPTNESSFGTSGTNNDDQTDVSVQQHADRSDRRALQDNIANIRLYHLLFYSEYKSTGSRTESPDTYNDDVANTEYNGDYQVLSAEAKPCQR